jgi:hypothetical protein
MTAAAYVLLQELRLRLARTNHAPLRDLQQEPSRFSLPI